MLECSKVEESSLSLERRHVVADGLFDARNRGLNFLLNPLKSLARIRSLLREILCVSFEFHINVLSVSVKQGLFIPRL